MAVDAVAYRRAVGHFATGVTVLTTNDDGKHVGMTANSFTSVSLDPVLALVAVEKLARFHTAVLSAGSFAVNILAADQEDLSRWYATRGRPDDHWHVEQWPHSLGSATGAAVFDGVLAALECRTVETFAGGDHTLLLGEVVALDLVRPDAAPLVYFKGGYRSL